MRVRIVADDHAGASRDPRASFAQPQRLNDLRLIDVEDRQLFRPQRDEQIPPGGGDARLNWRWDALELVTGLAVETQTDDRRGYENFIGSGPTQQLGVTGALRRDERNSATTREAWLTSRP